MTNASLFLKHKCYWPCRLFKQTYPQANQGNRKIQCRQYIYKRWTNSRQESEQNVLTLFIHLLIWCIVYNMGCKFDDGLVKRMSIRLSFTHVRFFILFCCSFHFVLNVFFCLYHLEPRKVLFYTLYPILFLSSIQRIRYRCDDLDVFEPSSRKNINIPFNSISIYYSFVPVCRQF